MSTDDNAVIPLHLVFEDELAAWRESQGETVRRWAREQSWSAERNRPLLVPGADGALAAVACGLGKRAAGFSLWHGAGLPERLPPRRFALAHALSDRDATQLWLGFAYGSYRFER